MAAAPPPSPRTTAARSSFAASPQTISTFSYPPSVSSKTPRRALSSSMATTFPARRASSAVRQPTPGPTSSARAFSSAPEASAMRRGTEGSMRKFCPSALEKRKPCRSSSAFTSAGLVRRISAICDAPRRAYRRGADAVLGDDVLEPVAVHEAAEIGPRGLAVRDADRLRRRPPRRSPCRRAVPSCLRPGKSAWPMPAAQSFAPASGLRRARLLAVRSAV